MADDPSKKRRVRFSLLNLVFAMTFIAMAFALWRLNAELQPLRVEVQSLRKAQGVLFVDDPEKVYAIQAPVDYLGFASHEIDIYRQIRVYIPEGRRYRLMQAVAGIPEVTYRGNDRQYQFPEQSHPVGFSNNRPISAGRHKITVRCRRRRDKKGELTANVLTSVRIDSGQKYSLEYDWPVPQRGDPLAGIEFQRLEDLEEFDPNKPAVLMYYRPLDIVEVEGGGGTLTPVHPDLGGFMLWIEPVEPE